MGWTTHWTSPGKTESRRASQTQTMFTQLLRAMGRVLHYHVSVAVSVAKDLCHPHLLNASLLIVAHVMKAY